MIYKYKAISHNGQAIEGLYEAEEESEVLNMIRSNGYLPVSIEKDIETQAQSSLFVPKVKRKDLAVFCRQFYTMINAGIGIIQTFEILEEQTKNKTFKNTIRAVREDIQKGYTISQSMKKHEKIFPNMLINMIEAGEISGTLDTILERMALHFERESKLEGKIKSAMIYPMALIIVSIVVIIFMLIAVLPTFVGMFMDSGVTLPWPTKCILDMSQGLKNYWFIVLIIGGVFGIFIHCYSSTPDGRRNIDNVKIKIPWIRTINVKIITTRFTRTLSILISSGIPLLESLDIVVKVLNNREIQYRLMKGMEDMSKGISLSKVICDVEIFPSMVEGMIKVGEESGALDEILSKTADFYDEEVEVSLQKMTTLIEPILLVLMAIVIGFIVIAMAMPMFDMVNTI